MQGNGIFSNLTFSEKRKTILFLLLEKPCTLQEINEYLGVKSPESQPRIKEMESVGLVIKEDDEYKLTLLGEIAAVNYKPFLDTVEAIERNKDFWEKHDSSAIPTEFLYRLRDLKDCKVIAAENFNICESHEIFKKEVANSISFEGAACIFIPEWIDMFSELSKQMVPIKILITASIYEKIKNEYREKLEEGFKNPHAHIYVCDDDDLHVAFATMCSPEGQFFSFSMNYNIGHYDTKNDLIGFDPAAIKWGKDLFQYYLANSIEIEHPPQDELIRDSCSRPLSV